MVRVIYLPPTSDPDLNTDLVQVSQMQQRILPDLLATSAHSMQRQRTNDSSQPRNGASLDQYFTISCPSRKIFISGESIFWIQNILADFHRDITCAS
jgi:hypothetical protein